MLGGLVSLALVIGWGGIASGADKAASKGKDTDAAAAPAAGLQTGPATIAPHW